MSHDRDRDRDRWRRGRGWGGRGWGGWNDWRFFGLPLQQAPIYVAPQPVVYPAPVYAPPLYYPQYLAPQRPQIVHTLFGQDTARGLLAAPADLVCPPHPVLTVPAGLSAPLAFRSRRKICGGKTRTVIARPEVAFQPTSLFIPCHVAKHFEIKAFRVGHISLLSSHEPISAEFYSNDCGRMLHLPPLVPGQSIYLRVRNTSSHKHRFRAVLDGVTLAL